MSSLYLADRNVVDHAYIDETGTIHGGSFSPCYYVEGELDPEEQVVVDFSTGKKQIKAIIDDCDEGMDHKLWITPTGNCVVEKMDETGPDVKVVTPHGYFIVRKERLFIVKDYLEPGDPLTYTLDNAGVWFERFINFHLQKKLKKYAPKVTVVNNEDFKEFPYSLGSEEQRILVPFRYTHGLKFSTSWGCRNPAHGHLSYMQLICTNATEKNTKDLTRILQSTYYDAVFIFSDNVIEHNSDRITIRYDDKEGVRYEASYNLPHYNVHVVGKETTIENLVGYIAEKNQDLFERAGVTRAFISEGLCKGAVWVK